MSIVAVIYAHPQAFCLNVPNTALCISCEIYHSCITPAQASTCCLPIIVAARSIEIADVTKTRLSG
jgi:hypothetical protein